MLLFGEAYDCSEGTSVTDYNNCGFILDKLIRQGSCYLKDLGGEFAGILIDHDNHQISIFNDQFGLYRLFLHVKGNTVALSSELKTLALNIDDHLVVNPRGFAEYLSCGCTFGSQSLFNSIEVLPEASWIEVKDGKITERKKYYDFETHHLSRPLSKKDFYHNYMKRFNESVLQCCNTGKNDTVGISLTGGLDSRMVLSSALKQGCMPLAFTFGSSVQSTMDVQISSKISSLVGIEHYPIIFDEKFQFQLHDYLNKAISISEGCIGLEGAAELYGNEVIREKATIRITGNYGSELLRGICAFKFSRIDKKIVTEDFDFHITAGQKSFSEMMLEQNKVKFIAYRQAQHQSFGRHAIERAQVPQRTPFMDPQLLKIINLRPEGIDIFALMKELIARNAPSLLDLKSDRGYLGKETGFRHKLIRNHREFMFKLEYLIGHGAPDYVIRLNDVIQASGLEKSITGRNKFCHIRQWYRDLLRSYVFEILTDPVILRILPFVDFDGIQTILGNHYGNKENHTILIDRLLSVVLFYNFLTRR